MAIERVPLIKQVPLLERVTLEDGAIHLYEPKKACRVRQNIQRRKQVRKISPQKAISMELREEGLLPRGFGSQLSGWRS